MGETLGNILRAVFWAGSAFFFICIAVYTGYGLFGAPEARKREALEREKEILEKRIAFLEKDNDFLTKVNAELQKEINSYGHKKG